MKTLIALFLLSLFVKDPCYMVDAVAVPDIGGTLYYCEDGNIFADYDRNSGSVVLVLDSMETDDVTDDVIKYVIEK